MEEKKQISHQFEDFYNTLNHYYKTSQFETLEKYLVDYTKNLETEGSHNDLLLTVYNELGSFYRSSSRYHDSLKAFSKGKEKIIQGLGRESIEYATLINNMAGTYRLSRQYDRAIAMFLEAIAIYECLGEEESYAYASVQNNISLAYQEMGQFEKAIEHLEMALDIIEVMSNHNNEIAVTYSNLTALYHEIGDDREAMACLNHALELFEAEGAESSVHYAAAVNSLGGFLYASGDYKRAIETYEKAAEHTQRHFGKNIDYGVSYQNMYWVYLKIGEIDQAIEVLMVAEKTYLDLFGPDHERTKMVQNELERARQVSAS